MLNFIKVQKTIKNGAAKRVLPLEKTGGQGLMAIPNTASSCWNSLKCGIEIQEPRL